MADLAAQREARRRKITENAEARMNRLIGLTKKSEQNNEALPQNSVSHNQDNEEPPYNTRLRSHDPVVSASSTSREIPTFVTSAANSEESSNRHSDDHIFIRSQTANTKVITRDDALQQTKDKSECAAVKTDNSSKIVPRLNAQTVEIMRFVILVVAALLARFVLKFGIGLFLVQSIFAPFIVLELTFEYVIYSYLQHIPLFSAKSNLMSAALMLCGMKQDILDTYNNLMAHITSFISDFCVYIFSFLVWNTFVA